MTKRTRFWTLAALSLTVGMAAPAAAEELRQGLNAPMILQMLSRPVEKPEAVMRERLRPDAPTARAVRSEGQVLPDGSVRYGTETAGVTMTIRNPCPPGDMAHEMLVQRSLPGRGRK